MHLPIRSAFVGTAVLAAALAPCLAHAAERLHVTVSHTLDIPRPSETITIPWADVNKALPGALLQKIAVKDSRGRVLPYQVTNVAPMAKDPKNEGIAYGELIFQYDFKAGEKSARFTVEKTEKVAPVFPTKAYARYVQERLDDFAWENDKIAHRTYGTALAAPDPTGKKEVLVTSGIDIWFKRVGYPVVDRWYNKGHDHYHIDEGEGMDQYQVGKTRGNGGTGVWDGKALATASNYSGWKILANGPVRAIFELSYDAFDAAGTKVSEVRRYTVDAGHYLDRIDTTWTFTGPQQITVAVGLNKTPTDKGQDPVIKTMEDAQGGAQMQWIEQKSNGKFGTAVIVPEAANPAFAQDNLNLLVLANVTSGKPLRYYAGAAWDRAGEIKTQEQWRAYVAAMTARAKAPIQVSLSASK
jgi:pectinesterase